MHITHYFIKTVKICDIYLLKITVLVFAGRYLLLSTNGSLCGDHNNHLHCPLWGDCRLLALWDWSTLSCQSAHDQSLSFPLLPLLLACGCTFAHCGKKIISDSIISIIGCTLLLKYWVILQMCVYLTLLVLP